MDLKARLRMKRWGFILCMLSRTLYAQTPERSIDLSPFLHAHGENGPIVFSPTAAHERRLELTTEKTVLVLDPRTFQVQSQHAFAAAGPLLETWADVRDYVERESRKPGFLVLHAVQDHHIADRGLTLSRVGDLMLTQDGAHNDVLLSPHCSNDNPSDRKFGALDSHHFLVQNCTHPLRIDVLDEHGIKLYELPFLWSGEVSVRERTFAVAWGKDTFLDNFRLWTPGEFGEPISDQVSVFCNKDGKRIFSGRVRSNDRPIGMILDELGKHLLVAHQRRLDVYRIDDHSCGDVHP